MNNKTETVNIIGAGLAGCEAALYLSASGVRVIRYTRADGPMRRICAMPSTTSALRREVIITVAPVLRMRRSSRLSTRAKSVPPVKGWRAKSSGSSAMPSERPAAI